MEWRGHPSTCSLASLRAVAMHRLRSDAGPDLSVRRLLRFGVASAAVNKILRGKNARDCSFSVDPSKDESHKRGGADYTRQSAEHVQACLTRTTERSDPSITPRPSVPVFWNVPSPTSSRSVLTDRPIQTVRPPSAFIFILIQRERRKLPSSPLLLTEA